LTSQAIPYILLQGFIFGTSLLASRFSIGQFHPLTYIGVRLSLAGVGHLAVYLLGRRRFPREAELLKRSVVMGIFGTAIPASFILMALQYLSGGITAVLITIAPAITVLMAHFVLPDESLNWRKAFGISLALSGALSLILLGESGLPDVSQVNPIGYGLVIGAMIFGGASTVYARKYMREMDSFDVASVRMVTAALIVMPISLLVAGFDFGSVDSRGYFALIYGTLTATFAGGLIGFIVIKRFGATVSAMVAYVIPVVAGIGGVLLLGEQITIGMIGGVALIMLGLALINRRGPQVVV
jgi:drug/metabolite transporter (DMT)-like permease